MGGNGSGRRYGPKKRVEECITLASSGMLQHNYLDLGVGDRVYHTITWGNCRNEPVYNLRLDVMRLKADEMLLRLFSTGQAICLRPTDCRLGGVRWWFSCPGCGRRCAKLYLPLGSMFLCRICHGLTYASCIEGKSMTAFLVSRASDFGVTSVELRDAIKEDTRARRNWRRKRDRRLGYKPRPWRLEKIEGKSLKRKALEAWVANDMSKILARLGSD